jgi:hypothetical protein
MLSSVNGFARWHSPFALANDYDRLTKLAEEQLVAQEKGANGD